MHDPDPPEIPIRKTAGFEVRIVKVPELLEAWEGEETRTRFTNYSMSSSVIRRNKELSLLDDKFEK